MILRLPRFCTFRASVLAVFLAGAALASLSACTLNEGAPAVDAPIVKTGNAKYDDFFNAVIEVRDQARRAPTDSDAGHADLAKVLGLDAKAKTSPVDAVGERAKKLQDRGVLLHLEIAPAPKVVALRGKVAVGPDGEALFKAMEGALQSSLDTRKRLATLALRAQELEKRRAELRDQVLESFKDEAPARRDEIMGQLDRMKDMLATAGDGASRAAGAESRFVVDLVYAAETGGWHASRGIDPACGPWRPQGVGPAPLGSRSRRRRWSAASSEEEAER